MTLMLKDKFGNELELNEVERLAKQNIRGSLSIRELIDFYINNISIDEIIEWACDDEGRFNE